MPQPTPRTPTDPDILDFLEESGWSANSLRTGRSVLVGWQDHLDAIGVAVMGADHRHLRMWLDAAVHPTTGAKLGGATLHKRWQVVQLFYKWAARSPDGEVCDDKRVRAGAGLLRSNPMARCKPPVRSVGKDSNPITVAALATLVDHFLRLSRPTMPGTGEQRLRALRNAAMVSLMHSGGMRSADVVSIDLDHLQRDATGAIVSVVVGGWDGSLTKNRRARVSPVNAATARLIERYLRRRGDAPGPLFIGRRAHTKAADGRLQAIAVQEVIYRAATACNLAVSSHDLRRGHVVEARKAGVPTAAIRRATGLSSDDLVDRYSGPHADVLAIDDYRRARGERLLSSS